MTRPGILLVNPWIHDFAAYDMWAKPLGLLVLGSMLKSQGWDPILVDCLDPDHRSLSCLRRSRKSHGKYHKSSLEKPEALQSIPRAFSRYGVPVDEIRKDLQNLEPPKAILVTCLMTYWYTGLVETCGVLREIFPGIPLILGGVYASLMPEHALKSTGVDEVIVGPAEFKLPDALYRWTSIEPANSAAAPQLHFAPDLDLLNKVRFLPLLTSRGCPYRCVYCASRIVQPTYERRSPREVIKEIELNLSKYDADEIVLYDDAFLCEANDYALPILDTFSSSNPTLKWHTPNGLHVSAITPTVASALKKAGFKTIRLGLESSSDQFHRSSGGKTRWDDFLKAVKYLRDAGFEKHEIGVYLLVGLPGQTSDQVESDVEMALEAGVYPRLAEYSPIPGSALWSSSIKTGRYPIESEPLYQNCSLLSVATEQITWNFLSRMRKMIHQSFESGRMDQFDSSLHS
ncbi:MAG: B12-binding domain-containing radical SAM protein [Desulfomonilaceae bacterium]